MVSKVYSPVSTIPAVEDNTVVPAEPYVILWSIPKNELAGEVVVIGAKVTSLVVLDVSIAPNESSPFVISIVSVGAKKTPTSFSGIVPCVNKLSVTVCGETQSFVLLRSRLGTRTGISGISSTVPSVRIVGPIPRIPKTDVLRNVGTIQRPRQITVNAIESTVTYFKLSGNTAKCSFDTHIEKIAAPMPWFGITRSSVNVTVSKTTKTITNLVSACEIKIVAEGTGIPLRERLQSRT